MRCTKSAYGKACRLGTPCCGASTPSAGFHPISWLDKKVGRLPVALRHWRAFQRRSRWLASFRRRQQTVRRSTVDAACLL